MGLFDSVSTIDSDVMNCYGLTLRGLPEDIEKVVCLKRMNCVKRQKQMEPSELMF